MTIFSIILARGGSEGIPRKNIYPINGKPLIYYTIKQCIEAGIENIYTSSDSEEILEIASDFGSKKIYRPQEFATNFSSSEEAWIHAIKTIKSLNVEHDWIFAPQVTSPIRHSYDIKNAFKKVISEDLDSLLSVVNFDDFFLWRDDGKNLSTITYDFKQRKRRQDITSKTLLENGSFYLFKPKGILESNNRLHGKIGYLEMERYKMYQIDDLNDIPVVEYFLNKHKIN